MSRPCVLIVEDNERSRKVLVAQFEKNAWETVEASTIEQGLASLASAPDCVILDLSLRDGKGETVLRKIRQDQLPVRVVAVVTGEDDPIRLGQVAGLKPDLLVKKPIDWELIWRYCDTQMRQSDSPERGD
jgi:CheY-like chemotaxis protein